MAAKFEIYKDKKGEYRFRFKSANGEIVASSEGYTQKSNCLKGINAIKRSAPDARLVDLDEDQKSAAKADSKPAAKKSAAKK